MDTIKVLEMKGYEIVNIIKVVFNNTLLELHFNIQSVKGKQSFSLSIGDDGETITYGKKQGWITPDDVQYEVYSTKVVTKDNDKLSRLISNEIKGVYYGIGKTLGTNESVIYYFRINTEENRFMFFNNGDKGEYSFDKIEGILSNDIYGYEWVDKLPVARKE